MNERQTVCSRPCEDRSSCVYHKEDASYEEDEVPVLCGVTVVKSDPRLYQQFQDPDFEFGQ
jgi:hypothetical protein